jgi:hypothetical protein
MPFIPQFVPREREFKDEDLGNYLSMTELSVFIQRSLFTIRRWYTWYYDDQYPKPPLTPTIPPIYQEAPRRKLYWHKDDLGQMIRFRNYIKRARPMGEFSATQWPEGYKNKSGKSRKRKVRVTDKEIFAKVDNKKKPHSAKSSRAEIDS